MANRGVVLIDSVLIDAVADAEAEYAMTGDEPSVLARVSASGNGRIQMRVKASTLVGAADFDITSIEYSYDGTLWRVWHTLAAALTIDAAGEKVGPEITELIPPDAQHIRLQITDNTVGGLDAGDNIILHVALEAVENS